MPLQVARYQLVLKDQSGSKVAVLDDYRSLQFQRKVNDVGFFTLIIDYNSPFRAMFEVDGQLEVYRKIPGWTDWRIEAAFHVEQFTTTLFQNGNFQYTIVGSNYKGLLKRRIIAYRDGTSYSDKNDVAETVMKEYVNENAGPAATVANNRLLDGVITGLSLEADSGAGINWQGERSGRNLLETLQDIANVSQIDFNVRGIGNALYEFATFANGLGNDLTTSGLDPATGLNAAGNAPFIFDPNRGNVSFASLNQSHRSEANAIIVFGKGKGATRVIQVETDAAAIANTPIAQREVMRGAGSQDNAAKLTDIGQEWLEKLQSKEDFSFTPLDTPSSLYGVHYDFADKVTARLGDFEADKRIISITFNIGEQGESKTIEFADIPR